MAGSCSAFDCWPGYLASTTSCHHVLYALFDGDGQAQYMQRAASRALRFGEHRSVVVLTTEFEPFHKHIMIFSCQRVSKPESLVQATVA